MMNTLIKILALFIFAATAASLPWQSSAKGSPTPSQYYTDSIYSVHLKEFRKHNVYLPKAFDSTKSYPIIYATDAEDSLENSFMKDVLDSLIDHGIIPPTIYVGSHANTKAIANSRAQDENGMQMAMQYRNFEYVDYDEAMAGMPELKDRFKNHMRYFVEELIPGVERELHQRPDRSARIFYGYSNGAGFGATLLNRHPSLIGTFICYSTLGSKASENTWDPEITYPRLYLQYGDEEGQAFKQEAETLQEKYREVGSFCDLKSFDGAHDIAKWNEAFTKTISLILAKS